LKNIHYCIGRLVGNLKVAFNKDCDLKKIPNYNNKKKIIQIKLININKVTN